MVLYGLTFFAATSFGCSLSHLAIASFFCLSASFSCLSFSALIFAYSLALFCASSMLSAILISFSISKAFWLTASFQALE
jgi:hypothetical protein